MHHGAINKKAGLPKVLNMKGHIIGYTTIWQSSCWTLKKRKFILVLFKWSRRMNWGSKTEHVC